MSLKEYSPILSYCLRNRQYNSILSVSQEEQTQRGFDPILQFWAAFSLGQLDQIGEALRTLKPLTEKRDVAYASLLLSISLHQKTPHPDMTSIDDCQRQLKQKEQAITDQGTLLTSAFYFYSENIYEAKKWIRRCLPKGKLF